MGGCLFGSAINLINGYNKKEYERLEGNTMPDIIQRLKDAYAENPAKALELLPELFKQYDDGLIPVLPCKVGDSISPDETIEEILIDKNGISLNIAESYSCDGGYGIRHRKEKYMDKKLNLCETCQKNFADCDNGEENKDFLFGNGIGNDNVYKCRAYKQHEVAEKALEEQKNEY